MLFEQAAWGLTTFQELFIAKSNVSRFCIPPSGDFIVGQRNTNKIGVSDQQIKVNKDKRVPHYIGYLLLLLVHLRRTGTFFYLLAADRHNSYQTREML